MKLNLRSVIGALRYTVEISEQEDFSGSLRTLNSVEDYQTSFIIKDLESSVTYYARVRINISGYGPVSSFTTRDAIRQKRLWGLTTSGGSDNLGTVFSFSIDSGTFLKHYNKQIFPEGYEETFWGTLVPGPEGISYGHSEHAYETHGFTLTREGNVEWWPYSSWFIDATMMLASDNFIYTTNNSGLGSGYAAKIDSENPGNFFTIRTFDQRSDGVEPGAPLIEADGGYLYGTAREGGFNEGGVVYRFRHDGSDFEVIHYFDHTAGGMNPYSGLTGSDTVLYGTTARGGEVEETGTVFTVKTDGSDFRKLHDFDAGMDDALSGS